jgi:hypothetical protein
MRRSRFRLVRALLPTDAPNVCGPAEGSLHVDSA